MFFCSVTWFYWCPFAELFAGNSFDLFQGIVFILFMTFWKLETGKEPGHQGWGRVWWTGGAQGFLGPWRLCMTL